MREAIDPGRLRQRMILEEPDDVPDGAGGATRSWTAVKDFWADLRPVSLRANERDGSDEQRITHELIYRAGPELNRAHRVRCGERLFGVLAVAEFTADGAFQKAMIEEVKP